MENSRPLLTLISEIVGLLDSQQRKALVLQQVLVVIMALAELVGVAAIGPFMALVGNPGIVETNELLSRAYAASGASSPTDFLFLMGVGVLVVMAASSAISVFTLWKNALFASRVGTQLADGLFNYYLHQPWLFHSSHAGADLSARITGTDVVTQLVIQPLTNIVARCVVIVFIAIPLLFFDPGVALSGLAIFSLAYLVLYRYVRRRLMANGVSTSALNHQRIGLRTEAFGGIRDVLLLHRQESFAKPFQRAGERIARNAAITQLLAQFPRYLIEFAAFSAIIFLILYLLRSHAGNLGEILPILAIYALGSFKLLPALQTVYSSLAHIRSGMGTYEYIREDLLASQRYMEEQHGSGSDEVTFKDSIELRKVEFTYPMKDLPALRGLSIEIPANRVIGLVGMSGSGKSTAIDVLLGLIKAGKGEFLIDGKPLRDDQVWHWQNKLGFVPQNLFLADASILKNIAFGLPDQAIDMLKVGRAVRFAHLEDYIAKLPEGLDTQVGERGVQLSGGQRQRIGIARALYNDAEVLLLDEATSSLDGITESIIMDAIHDFSGKKTIIMIAHRLSTVQKCDLIYLIDQGRVIDQGSYVELFERNPRFREMAGQGSRSAH